MTGSGESNIEVKKKGNQSGLCFNREVSGEPGNRFNAGVGAE